MEVDLEAGTFFGGGKLLKGRMAAHALHEDAYQVQSHACAAGFRAFFEERAGRRRCGLGWVAVIANAQDNIWVVAVRMAGNLDAERVAFGVPDAVVEQVAQDDLESGRIGEDAGVLDGCAGFDGALEGRAPVSESLGDGFGEIEGLGKNAATTFNAGEFECPIDLGFETSGVVE